MAIHSDLDSISSEIRESIKASVKRQRRLKSRTLWSTYGVKHRTDALIESVAKSLYDHDIRVTLAEEYEFGREPKDEWITLTLEEPEVKDDRRRKGATQTPSDEWFAAMGGRDYQTEREVEYYFVIPLLTSIGYSESEIAIGHVVEVFEGVKKTKKEADVIVFDGPGREPSNALILVEAKRCATALDADCVGQARGYAMWTGTPYYVVTNGDEVQVNRFRGAVQSDVREMRFHRTDLRAVWPEFQSLLGRSAVLRMKRRMARSVS